MRIGIIGGGQLGMYLAHYAKKLGHTSTIVERDLQCPGVLTCDKLIQGDFNDPDTLKKLAENSDIITYEFENIDAESIRFLENHGSSIPQTFLPLYISQNRSREKEAAQKYGLQTAPWFGFSSAEELLQKQESLLMPYIIKTASMGYDGKGQWVIKDEEDLQRFIRPMEEREYIAEAQLSFQKELSCIVCRSLDGTSVVFGPIENIHHQGILHVSISPARVLDATAEKARSMSKEFVEAMNFYGIITLELFLMEDGAILFNEMAPRPHNSGHLTMDAMNVSQYENAIRALVGDPLLPIAPIHSGVMVNVLGQDLPVDEEKIRSMGGRYYDYGKNSSRTDRKVGHITFLDGDVEALIKQFNRKNEPKDLAIDTNLAFM